MSAIARAENFHRLQISAINRSFSFEVKFLHAALIYFWYMDCHMHSMLKHK